MIRAASSNAQSSGLLPRRFRVRDPGGPQEETVARKFADWVRGWIATLDIMINNRELYRYLKGHLIPEDLADAPRPE